MNAMKRRIEKKHIGMSVTFNGYDGQAYTGKIESIKNRMVQVSYYVRCKGDIVANLPVDTDRLELL